MIIARRPRPLFGLLSFLALFSFRAPIDAQATPGADASPDAKFVERARALLKVHPLVDGHNDLPWQYRERGENRLDTLDLKMDLSALEPRLHTDFPRLAEGGLGGQFWSVYVPTSFEGSDAAIATFEQIDVVKRLTERYPDRLEMAYTAADVTRIHRAGKIASLIGMEGGHSIASSLGVLRELYRAGARYMTITHSKNVAWADSATDAPKVGGLSKFGVEVVREMNRVGMLVDLSHVSPETMHDALDVAVAPVIFSHSSARALVDHPRNIPDDVLVRLPKNGGVAMVTFVPTFVSSARREWSARQDGERARWKALLPEDPKRVDREVEAWTAANPAPQATVSQIADHIEHVRKVAGVDHVGIGSDFDGISATPFGLDGVEDYPVLFAELLRRGWSETDLAKLAGGNVLRAFAEAEKVAARLQKERPPSEARIEELDAPTAGGAAAKP